jgi:hypothetical protein
MDELRDTDRQLIRETHDAIIELSSMVLGVKGQGGLVSDIRSLHLDFKNACESSTKDRLVLTELTILMSALKPKLEELDEELNNDETGVTKRVVTLETSFNGINRWIVALWSVLASVSAAFLTLVLTRL